MKFSKVLQGPDVSREVKEERKPIPKHKRSQSRDYLNWVATLPCVNCGIEDDTIVAHHLKHRHAPHSGGGTSMKANDYLTMPLCYTCHAKAHNGDRDILDWQADFIFKTQEKAFSCGELKYKHTTGGYRTLFGEELYD